MSGLKEQLFQQYAVIGLNKLLTENRILYTAKKGDRFYYQGITYEIGLPNVKNGIEFEISSKIPQADLLPGVTLDAYFGKVKQFIRKTKNTPASIDMYSIIRDTAEEEDRERGYVKLKYFYTEKDLYNDAEIVKELRNIAQGKSKTQLSPIPEATTLAGKLVLHLIQERIYARAKENMALLLKANEEVKKKLCKK